MESGTTVAETIAADQGDGLAWRRLRGLTRAARPWHWTKNLACFAGLVFSGKLFQIVAILAACRSFVAFSLAASAVYLVNDVCDRHLDRRNPAKRHRPIASGLVPVSWALAAAVLLMAGAVAVSWSLGPLVRLVVVIYGLMGVGYSLRLKHTVLLDVFTIALGFVLRVLIGVYAVGVLPTPWIVLCMFFLALFLGFSKRRGELGQLLLDDHERRPVLSKYRVGLLDLMLGMTATMTILCYTLYTVTGRPGNPTLAVTVPLVVYGIFRQVHLVVVHGAGEAPERELFLDRTLLGTVALWVAACTFIIYNTHIQFFHH